MEKKEIKPTFPFPQLNYVCIKEKKKECNCKKCKPLHHLLKKYPIF